jgi:excisionase family DNA binding protein
MSELAIITVSAQEWNETKDMIKNISNRLNEMATPTAKELLTPKEVCQILKCGRSTFENLKGNGAFPLQRTPGTRKVYVLRSDLDKAILSGSI